MIRAKGFSAERFMNLAAERGIFFWDVVQAGASMTMKAPMGSLPLLEACGEKTGCTVELAGQGGLPVFFRRFRKKEMFSVGIFLFAAGLYLLSSFVWIVEVEGNERIPEEKLLSACRELGLSAGTRKRSADPARVTEELLLSFPELSWVNVSIKGTKAVVRLSETIEKVPAVDTVTPSDIRAAHDGLILKITAERGTPVVRAGDMVKKGDLLISAELSIPTEGEEAQSEYTAAEGSVTARCWERFLEKVPFFYGEAVPTGKCRTNYSLILGERELDLIRPRCEGTWEKTPVFEKQPSLGDASLPFKWKKEVLKEIRTEKKTRTSEEAKTLLTRHFREKAEALVGEEGLVEEVGITFREYADGLLGEARAVVVRRIEERTIRTEKGREAEDE